MRNCRGSDREELGGCAWVEMSHKSVMLERESLASIPSNIPKGMGVGYQELRATSVHLWLM